jgi:hypothetical protein
VKTARVRLLGAVLIFFAAGPLLAGEDLIKIEAGIVPRRLSRGQGGKVVLKVGLKKGIAISALPAFTIEFEGNEDLVFPKSFFTGSDLTLSRSKSEARNVSTSRRRLKSLSRSDRRRDGGFMCFAAG